MKQFSDPITTITSRFINNTNKSIFLTGRAGTGKTTFLKSIIHSTHKNVIVAAPTGIAAINAGGVTLHSLFQLPFGSYIPENISFTDQNITSQINTPRSLMSSFQMNKTKRNMLNQLELLIIDEVSMLRADLLDAIDSILRHVRRNRSVPFGGVQILFIGDLLQLPPVVKDSEWPLLSKFYDAMYFFNARVLKENQPLYVELDKIYRQSDSTFIRLLNNLRDNTVTDADLEILNQHFKVDFDQKGNDGYILLTTHNRIADEKNKVALEKIESPTFKYEAVVEGDFSEYQYPIDKTMELKKGAQVMFIKNDYSGDQKYFNGKIGTISQIDKEDIVVSFPDGSESANVERYTWENRKYKLNPETNEIEETLVGQFTQYPLRLAWAITVHKSQGLTFEKAIIDVGKAFAPGQIYVALSRLTSLDGLVLTSKIPLGGLKTDAILKDFSRTKKEVVELEDELVSETKVFFNDFIIKAFDFEPLRRDINYHISTYNKDQKKSLKQQYKAWAVTISDQVDPLKTVADSFQKQVRNITLSQDENYISHLLERITAAIKYFEPLLQKISDQIFDKMNDLQGQKGIKTYLNELRDLESLFYRQLQLMYKAESFVQVSLDNIDFVKENIKEPESKKTRKVEAPKKKALKSKSKPQEKKKKKEDTKDLTYQLYKEGRSIKQIALDRSLVEGTIEGHMAHFVREGKIDVTDLLNNEKLEIVEKTVKELDTFNLGPLKAELGQDFTYGELRMAVAGILAKKEGVVKSE